MPVTSEQANDQATSTGALEVPAVADTTAQSMTAAIMADLGDEPLIPPKAKRGRPKKVAPVEETDPDDDSAPPASLLAKLAGGDEADDEPEAEEAPEATEGDDEPKEPAELEDQLALLAQDTGVDPGLLEGCESVGEAERLVNKLFGAFYNRGADQNGQASNASHQQQMPAAPNGAVQKTTADDLEIDLSKYDDDEPIKSDLQKLIDRDKRREAELTELKAEKDRARAEEFQRVQQHVATQFQNEFYKVSPELFGSQQAQSAGQARKMRQAFEVADTLIRGYAAAGQSVPSIAAVAKWAVNAAFADELATQKVNSKRASIQNRVARRSVGAPAQNGRSPNGAPSGKVNDGPMEKDPDILSAVRGVLARSRA